MLSLGVTRGVHRADVLGEHGVRDARGRRAVADDGDVEGGARARARVGAAPVLRLGLGLGLRLGLGLGLGSGLELLETARAFCQSAKKPWSGLGLGLG